MPKDTPKTIDDYLRNQPEDVGALLSKVREVIRAALPEATEKIAWGMPTFWQEKNVIHFAAFKDHLGIYPGELSRLTPFVDRLAGLNVTKGAIQFPYEEPVDYELIADIARYRKDVITGVKEEL